VIQDKFLVTGAMGCIGAWVLRVLSRAGIPVVAFDLAVEPARPRLLMNADELSRITFVQGDVSDSSEILSIVEKEGITHVVHLAGLQVPACKANPSLGAAVNVLGTVNVFEAVRLCQGQVRGLAYASSVAALGPGSFYVERPIEDDVPLRPETLYGVYKMADENIARLYWQDWRIASVGLRPYIVYGVGRDQGLTSDIARAILAAAAGRSYHIYFDGLVALQYAEDVARTFVACARSGYQGAASCNLRNDVIEVADFVTTLRAEVPTSDITVEVDHPLPFPADLDDSGLREILGTIPHTPLDQAIRDTLSLFRGLLEKGLIIP
jgi:nucleoside-diphosphate-sugar epimerase